MKKVTIIILTMVFWSSCQPKKEVNKVQLVKEYVNALNESDFKKVTSFFMDSIRMKEIDYVSVFSKAEYLRLFQWDSTFQPKYQILGIKEENGSVRMQVSKECKRILFLNEEPNVTDELVKFENSKITSIEILSYVVFNDEKWSKNRADLTSWIETNYPEMHGFLHDQSKEGAMNYLKAIELYQENEN